MALCSANQALSSSNSSQSLRAELEELKSLSKNIELHLPDETQIRPKTVETISDEVSLGQAAPVRNAQPPRTIKEKTPSRSGKKPRYRGL